MELKVRMGWRRRVALWVVQSVVLASLLFLLPGLVQPQAVSVPQREALERAFGFLSENGHAGEVAELRQLVARGRLHGGELASTDNAETVGRVITVKPNLLLPIGNPGTLAEFKSTSQLAQVNGGSVHGRRIRISLGGPHRRRKIPWVVNLRKRRAIMPRPPVFLTFYTRIICPNGSPRVPMWMKKTCRPNVTP